jgi:iron complex outermembrane receptor protein
MASTLLTGMIVLATPAFAQQAPAVATIKPPCAPGQTTGDNCIPVQESDTTIGDLVITGSRIANNEFTSPSPVQVITSEQARARGLSDTVQFLQSATVAAGSPQNNATISSAFVTDGGPGSATISLRGLGANRTLVLLNGRRAGPAGTRGGVSAVDLNVLPNSAIERIEILKDGASSIYGSDAIAGVVNIITKKHPDGGEVSVFYTTPEKRGGEQANVSANWGKTVDDGHVSFSLDYYKQFELKNGQRGYTKCAPELYFDQVTHQRRDLIDPRTGEYHCNNTAAGQVWVYDEGFHTRRGKFQYDYDGKLAALGIPQVPTGLPQDYPNPPPGYYLVGYDRASTAYLNANNPLEDQASLIPSVTRATAYFEAAKNLTPDTELYTEILLNRRESKTAGFRQFWTYNYTNNFLDVYYYPGPTRSSPSTNPGCCGGDPFNQFTGSFILSPTAVTDHFGASQRVDYTRGVFGLRGKSNFWGKNPWTWDIYAQLSRSQGAYRQDVLLQDAVDSQSFRTGSCVGSNLPISGKPCQDFDTTNPQFLIGNLTPAQQAYFYDVDTGHTRYDQDYVEGFVSGAPFDLPAGPFGVALGFTLRHDKIVDTPGAISAAGNSWGLSSAGVTKGSDTTREVFGELQLPLIKDRFLMKDVDLSLSGRYTDVRTSGSAGTYKVGLNWQVVDQFKVRGTYGTSFRAPALFELYLGNQTDFSAQKDFDPCIDWANKLSLGTLSARVAANCANPAGPGGGVAGNHSGAGAGALITTGGGLGVLKPETSTAEVLGVVWTPKFSDISLSVDYFRIKLQNEVTNLGSRAVAGCYNSLNFPTDPLCSLFVRNPGSQNVDTINSIYRNVAEEVNAGFDVTLRYRKPTPWGDVRSTTQFTYQKTDTTALFAGFNVDSNGASGHPKQVGSETLSFDHGPWTAFWTVEYVGPTDNSRYDSSTVDVANVVGGCGVGRPNCSTYDVKIRAEPTFFHTISGQYTGKGWEVTAGIANVFNEKPPAMTPGRSATTIGYVALESNYTEGYTGRRYFLSLSKKL